MDLAALANPPRFIAPPLGALEVDVFTHGFADWFEAWDHRDGRDGLDLVRDLLLGQA